MHKWRTIILLFLPLATGVAQTRVELSTQSNADFSRAKSTRPAQVGTSLPVTCNQGEVFFNIGTSVAAGQNLFLCATANTWTQLTTSGGGGGGGATSSSALTDLTVTLNTSAPTQLNIASSCTASTPCRVRFGASTFTLTTSATVTVPTGASVGGMVYIYVSSGGAISVFTTVAQGVTCSGCTVTTLAQFPSDSIPLATWTASAGQFDVLGEVDLRAFISNRANIAAGVGIVVADSPGQITLSADTSVVGVRIAPPATSSSACATGNYAADTSFFYQCVAANTWLRVAIATW